PREVVPLGADDVAVARIGERALAAEVVPALGETVAEKVVVKAALTVDVDAADLVDQLLERRKIDAHEGVHRLIEDARDRVAQQPRAGARISALSADLMRVIDAVRAVRADAHP